MNLAFLFTRSELTPWKENVNEETLQFLMENAPSEMDASIVHFDGFNDGMLDKLRWFDLVFNLSYGYGEAGQVEVAAWLEQHGILHTASSRACMALAQDKSLLPSICAALGLSTPEVFTCCDQLEDGRLYLAKPRTGSCHRNISIESGGWMKQHLVPEQEDLLIQPYIFGREFSVAVVPSQAGGGYMALPPAEIAPECDTAIYVAGQSFGKTWRNLSPDIPESLASGLKAQAMALHDHIGLRGMSRTDFRLSDEGVIHVLDVNAMPNMDPRRSILPALCLHHGVGIRELIRRLVGIALEGSAGAHASPAAYPSGTLPAGLASL